MELSAVREVEKQLEESGEPESNRDHAIFELCDCMIDLVSTLFGVCGREMRQSGRSHPQISRARQIAMYVAHTVLELSMKEVGRGFGKERTTVLHAVHLVEDMRDDPEIDELIGRTEHLATTLMRGRKAWSLR